MATKAGSRQPDLNLSHICVKQALDNHNVAPHIVELPVLFIDANFAESQALQQRAAGAVFNKHARQQLPEACCFGSGKPALALGLLLLYGLRKRS